MITEHDLQEAIAECQGQRNPNANTCIKLAAFLTIQREMFGDERTSTPIETYSFSSDPHPKIEYSGDTPFTKSIYGMDISKFVGLMDELMTTLEIINPGLYNGVMRKVTE